MSEVVMVTGGAGFIGRHLVKALRERGHEVFSFDIREDPRYDITNYEILRKCVEAWKPDVVFHLAANPRVDVSFKDPLADLSINVLGTLNLLRALEGRPPRLVFISTAHVYGEPQYLPIDERHPICPMSPYAISKYAAERYCLTYGRRHGIEVVVTRLFNTYGPGQNLGFVIPDLIHRLLENPDRLVVYGTGEEVRDFVYVSDVVSALIKAMERGEEGECYNVGSGSGVSISELVSLLIEAIGVRPREVVFTKKGGTGRPNAIIADISKAKRSLKWEPVVGLKEGLKRTVESMREKFILR